MTGRPRAFLVDTNVLVYAYDPADPAKQARAATVLERLAGGHAGALSAQVLGEFFVTVTRRILPPLTQAEAERSVTNYARSWPVHDITWAGVLEAVRGVRRHRLPYWDSLIWATAKLNGVPNVLSEDFSHGALVDGVRFLNPFSESFDLAALAPAR
jgi:predicted nucleic acid-binding protein